jgi:MATE family, multidrug efflux pump
MLGFPTNENIKKTFLLAYPVSLTYVSHMLTGLADNIMVGKVGAVELAASSFANNVLVMPLVFGLGMSFGLTPLIANAHGREDLHGVNKYQQAGLALFTVLGCLMAFSMVAFAPLIKYLNQPEEIVRLGLPYFKLLAWSMIPFMIFQSFKQFSDGVSKTKLAMYVSFGGNFINIILNYLLIYGKFGFPRLELMGAGYATLISRILMAVTMGILVHGLKSYKEFNLDIASRKAMSKFYFRELFNLGGPSGLQMVFEAGAFSISALMVGTLGYQHLAAHQIAISLASLTYVGAAGIGSAATIRVGNQVGARNFSIVRDVGYTSIWLSGVYMGICGIVLALLSGWLPGLYVDDFEVIKMASILIIISAAFQVFDGVQVGAQGALRGLPDVRVPTIYAAVSYWLIGLPISYLLGIYFSMGVEGIWYGFIAGLGVSAFLLTKRFKKKTDSLILN